MRIHAARARGQVRRLVACILYLAATVIPVVASKAAEPPGAPTARALLDQTRQLAETTRKWTDRTQELALTIVDRRGGQRHRTLTIRFKKYPEDRNRTILFFESPPEVKGVGFLQWADPHGKDEQWLYLPELKRVRQISTGAKRESFVGTDFSYDDLAIISQITDWSDTDARTVLLRDEAVDGQPCHVIEFTPTGKDLTYGKLLVWLRAGDLVIVKYEFYDSDARLEKILALGDIRLVGAIPTAFHWEMQNVQAGSHTIVDFSAVRYDSGLDDAAFTERALEHGP
jgi:outer membrane lipoprotein-sorting protein